MGWSSFANILERRRRSSCVRGVGRRELRFTSSAALKKPIFHAFIAVRNVHGHHASRAHHEKFGPPPQALSGFFV